MKQIRSENQYYIYLSVILTVFTTLLFFNSLSAETLQSKELSNGVKYKVYAFKSTKQVTYKKKKKRYKRKVTTTTKAHVVEIDLEQNGLSVKILKPYNKLSERERLHKFVADYDSINKTNTLAAINGSFWQAGTNYPVGPLVIDSKLVNKNKYKEWSSFYISNCEPFIDRLDFEIVLKNGKDSLTIQSLNRRGDSLQTVLYNRYYADTLGKVNLDEIQKKVNEAIQEAKQQVEEVEDSTEIAIIDSAKIFNDVYSIYSKINKEYKYKKYLFKYTSPEVINKEISIKYLRKLDSGAVEIPENGFIITTKDDLINFTSNDTKILFKSNSNSNIEMSLSGTPRLVRNGIAKHEAAIEGSRSRRFINGSLPRTAIGYNKSKTKLYFVTVEAAMKSNNQTGATLEQLAKIMKDIGCYDALNLDGGGSSAMLINGENVNIPTRKDFSRKLAVILSVSKLK